MSKSSEDKEDDIEESDGKLEQNDKEDDPMDVKIEKEIKKKTLNFLGKKTRNLQKVILLKTWGESTKKNWTSSKEK